MAAGDVSTGIGLTHSMVEQPDSSLALLVKPADGLDTKVHAYSQVTVPVAAKSLADLSVTVPAWAILAFISPEDGDIRYRADGTDPTSSVGVKVAMGAVWPIQGKTAIAALKLIAAANTVVSIEFRG